MSKIGGVFNKKRLHQSFSLEEPGKIRIYALGEGDDDEMFDFGYIEDEDGNKVWRMEPWDTEHAGGAGKNRMVNEVIRLDAGRYTVHYRSDGSHSYDRWNSSPPVDTEYWGITVRKEND